MHYARYRKYGDPNIVKSKGQSAQKIDRDMAAVILREAGFTLANVGKVLGITRERVRQICEKYRR